MLKYIIFFLLVLQTFANSKLFILDRDEAILAQDFLKNQQAILIVNNGVNFNYKEISSVNISVSSETNTNMFNEKKLLGTIDNDYIVKVNNQKIDLQSTYIRDSSNKNKWIRLGSLVDQTTYKHQINDVYYTYSQKDKIPKNLTKRIQPVKNNGRPSVVLIPDEEYNQKQKEKEASQVYEELEQRHIPD